MPDFDTVFAAVPGPSAQVGPASNRAAATPSAIRTLMFVPPRVGRRRSASARPAAGSKPPVYGPERLYFESDSASIVIPTHHDQEDERIHAVTARAWSRREKARHECRCTVDYSDA